MFSGWRAVMVKNAKIFTGFRHIVEAGGGALAPHSPATLATATHVLCDQYSEDVAVLDIARLAALGIEVLHNNVVADLLTDAAAVALAKNRLTSNGNGAVTRSGSSRNNTAGGAGASANGGSRPPPPPPPPPPSAKNPPADEAPAKRPRAS